MEEKRAVTLVEIYRDENEIYFFTMKIKNFGRVNKNDPQKWVEKLQTWQKN